MKQAQDDIIWLIVKSLRGKITPEEELFLSKWKFQSKANEQMYQRLEIESREHTEYPLFRQFHSRREWSLLLKGIYRRRFVRRMSRVAVAASFILFGVSSYFIFSSEQDKAVKIAHVESLTDYSFSKKARLILPGGDTLQITSAAMDTLVRHSIFVENTGNTLVYHSNRTVDTLVYNTLEIPRGGAYSLQLADGTKVMLNSDSRLRFPETFSNDLREVYLEGEAYFQVAKNAQKPFIVHCDQYQVRVLGTSFNISAYPDDRISMTTLVEGRVQVECGDTTVFLLPGVMASVSGSKVSIRAVDVDSYISWTRDQFSFSEERLEDLFKKISRWYDVDFVYEDTKMKEYKFSGFIPRYESITAVLQIMEQAANVSFKMDNRRIVVSKNQE